MNYNTPNLNDTLAILSRTPASLAALLDGLPDTFVTTTEGGQTWSPFDVIGHLIHAERTDWIPRARHIMSRKEGPFDPFDRTAQFGQNDDKKLSELLSTFSDLRRENLVTLTAMNLSDADLSRTGLHPELGEVTLRGLLATWIVHDLDHVAQIARTIAKAYTEAVGPWRVYLSILDDRRSTTS